MTPTLSRARAFVPGRIYLFLLPLAIERDSSISSTWGLFRVNAHEIRQGREYLTLWNPLTRRQSRVQIDDSIVVYESLEDANRTCHADLRRTAEHFT